MSEIFSHFELLVVTSPTTTNLKPNFRNSNTRGLGGFTDVSAPGGKSALGEFANHGAQPGSGYGSFITAGSK